MRLKISKWGNNLTEWLHASYAKQFIVFSGTPSKVVLQKYIFSLRKTLPQTISVIYALRERARY